MQSTPRLFDGAAEARLIALACGTPPEGRARLVLFSLHFFRDSLLTEQYCQRTYPGFSADSTVVIEIREAMWGLG